MLCQGCELITANYIFCTFACLAAKPEDRAAEIKATLINWVVCWTFNLLGAILHFSVVFAWQTGLIMTVAVDNKNYADSGGALENNKIFYESSAAFQEHFNNGDFCSTGSNRARQHLQAHQSRQGQVHAQLGTALIRGAGCNWMVCLAIWLQMIATEPGLKFIMIWLPIELFISSGFDHLVVNEFLIPGGIIVGGSYIDSRVNFLNRLLEQLHPRDHPGPSSAPGSSSSPSGSSTRTAGRPSSSARPRPPARRPRSHRGAGRMSVRGCRRAAPSVFFPRAPPALCPALCILDEAACLRPPPACGRGCASGAISTSLSPASCGWARRPRRVQNARGVAGLGGDAPADERRERRRDVVVRHGGTLRAEGEGPNAGIMTKDETSAMQRQVQSTA